LDNDGQELQREADHEPYPHHPAEHPDNVDGAIEWGTWASQQSLKAQEVRKLERRVWSSRRTGDESQTDAEERKERD
jgi:hypothetical protein